jgi:hypothetical protein
VLFHLEYRGQDQWEAFGSGEGGDGEEASAAALADLIELAGAYRARPARGSSTRWDLLQLGPRGEIRVGDERLPEA